MLSKIITGLCLSILFVSLVKNTFAYEPQHLPLKVGFIGPFSGPAQIYGTSSRNGFELALDELGRDWIEVFYEDDQYLPAKSVAAFNKLVDFNKVDLVIIIGSSPSSAIAPLAQARRVPLIAWASDARVSTGRSFVIRSYPSGYAEGALVAKRALELGFKNIASIISSNDYAQSWKEGFEDVLPASKLLMSEEITAEIPDFRSVLLRMRQRGVREVGICLNPGMTGLFARQAREMGIDGAIFGCENLHDHDEVKSSHGALYGAWFATIGISESYRQKYLARFGNDSVISGAGSHEAVARALSTLPRAARGSDLVKALLEMQSFTGEAIEDFLIKELNDDRFFDIPLEIKIVADER